MKKIIQISIFILAFSFGAFASNKSIPIVNNSLVSKPVTYVCWISEIYYSPTGTVTISISCKSVCESCGYAVNKINDNKTKS